MAKKTSKLWWQNLIFSISRFQCINKILSSCLYALWKHKELWNFFNKHKTVAFIAFYNSILYLICFYARCSSVIINAIERSSLNTWLKCLDGDVINTRFYTRKKKKITFFIFFIQSALHWTFVAVYVYCSK